MGSPAATSFSVADGYLRWTDPRFYEGHAGFCRVPSGQVYATFHAQSTWPFDCEPVDLWVDLASWCRERQIAYNDPEFHDDSNKRLAHPFGEHDKPRGGEHHGHDERDVAARTNEHHRDHDDKDKDKDHKKKKEHHHDKDHKKGHKKDHKKHHDKGHKKEHHKPTPTHHYSSHRPTHHYSSDPPHYTTSSYHYYTSSSYSYEEVPHTAEPPSVPPATRGGDYPTQPHVYPVDAAPTAPAGCEFVPMSWHVGVANPTFIKDEL
ncbi:hypothetical protein GGR52DRAFT_544999 [Hypoxylon sp. FL1284]|nr:hypothetical protein GGR52DRAFT_544999 [Hypoxylon sp. FL1284]